jgi:hypothetical protein
MTKHKKNYLTLIILIISQIFLTSCSYSRNTSTINNLQSLTTWLWDTSLIETDSDNILDFLSENNVKVLYLQIDKKLDIKFYKEFISSARNLDISIYALDGRPEFIYPNKSEYKLFFDWVSEYQSSSLNEEKFQGINLDVEPYLLKNWDENQNSIVLKYQVFILDSIERANVLNLPIGFDMPFWFDSINYSNTYGNGTLAEFVIKNSNNTTIMAYRNVADDIVEISKNEIAFADKYDKTLCIGIETLYSEEGEFISFYGKTSSNMDEELELVKSNFSFSNSFNGIAIHDITGWIQLKN